jgi:hypothetical protein
MISLTRIAEDNVPKPYALDQKDGKKCCVNAMLDLIQRLRSEFQEQMGALHSTGWNDALQAVDDRLRKTARGE